MLVGARKRGEEEGGERQVGRKAGKGRSKEDGRKGSMKDTEEEEMRGKKEKAWKGRKRRIGMNHKSNRQDENK